MRNYLIFSILSLTPLMIVIVLLPFFTILAPLFPIKVDLLGPSLIFRVRTFFFKFFFEGVLC